MMSVDKKLVIKGLFALFVQNHFALTIYVTFIFQGLKRPFPDVINDVLPLFASQRFYRVGQGRFDGLTCYRQKSHDQCQRACHGKHPPFHRDTVFEIL